MGNVCDTRIRSWPLVHLFDGLWIYLFLMAARWTPPIRIFGYGSTITPYDFLHMCFTFRAFHGYGLFTLRSFGMVVVKSTNLSWTVSGLRNRLGLCWVGSTSVMSLHLLFMAATPEHLETEPRRLHLLVEPHILSFFRHFLPTLRAFHSTTPHNSPSRKKVVSL